MSVSEDGGAFFILIHMVGIGNDESSTLNLQKPKGITKTPNWCHFIKLCILKKHSTHLTLTCMTLQLWVALSIGLSSVSCTRLKNLGGVGPRDA